MGEYEDRYPEAYGRDETARRPATPPPEPAQPQRQSRSSSFLRRRFGLTPAAETAPAWQHAPRTAPPPAPPEPVRLIEPTASPPRAADSYRGVGPRGYVRSDRRIYEDICDRLTENPFVDASDIEVAVRGGTVTLAGSVANAAALRQAEEIARDVAGVAELRNALSVRAGGRQRP